MCTVSFVPHKEGFVFTSNRDEDPARAATQLIEKKTRFSTVYYMEDPLAKGTWFAFSTQRFVCVLNGAFEPHQRKASYRMSRGAMALESFQYDSLKAFRENFSFDGLEPFTLVLYNQGDFQEWIWDEKELHVRLLSTDAVHLWSSRTLYTRNCWATRKKDLNAWKPKAKSQEKIMEYHKTQLPFSVKHLEERLEGVTKLTNIPLQTTSVSSIQASSAGFSFVFQSNVNGIEHRVSLN